MANKKIEEEKEMLEQDVNKDAEKTELAPVKEEEPKTKKDKIVSGLRTAVVFLVGAGVGIAGTMFLGKKKNSDNEDDVDYSYEETK